MATEGSGQGIIGICN